VKYGDFTREEKQRGSVKTPYLYVTVSLQKYAVTVFV